MAKQMKGITVCADCAYYSLRKHKCTRGCTDEGSPQDQFYKDCPLPDVVERLRGEWKKHYADHEAFGVRPFFRYCSKCNEATIYPYNFCPNCGADMREADNG